MSTAVSGLLSRPFRPIGAVGVACAALVVGVAVLAAGEAALLGLIGACVFAVILRWPVVGLYLTTALLLLSGPAGVVGSVRVAIPVTFAKVTGGMTFAAWLMNVVARGRTIRVGWESLPLILFFLWSAVGVFASPTWDRQWPEWFRLGTLVAFFILAVNLLDREERVHRFTMLILYCGVAMSLFAAAQFVFPALHLDPQTAIADIGAGGGGAFVDPESVTTGAAVRVSGSAGHSNWLALIILLIMPLNVYWYQTARSFWSRLACVAAVLLEVVALILTFTRTGFLVGVVILAVLGARRLVRVNPYRLSALALAVVLAWLVLPAQYKERVLNFPAYAESESVHHRLQLQEAAWEMMQERPVWGVGLGGYGLRVIDMTSEVALIMRWLVDEQNWSPLSIGTHNMYLQVGSETGVVGLGLILLFFGLLLRDLRRAERRFLEVGDARARTLVAALQVSVISFLLCAVFLHALQQKIWWMMTAVAAVLPLYKASLGEASSPAPSDATHTGHP